MLVLLSPSKKQEFKDNNRFENSGKPYFTEEIEKLVSILKKYSINELMQKMDISEELAAINFKRFQNFQDDFTTQNSNSAIKMFKGDVYAYLQLDQYNNDQLDFMQKTFRILSGLYGILSPFDLVQPYRLEMSTLFMDQSFKDLYHFWGDKITLKINQDIIDTKSKYVINLASNEYWNAVHVKNLKAPVINIKFQENRNGVLKTIALNAKRARSMMSHFITQNCILDPKDLLCFNDNGYKFSKSHSKENEFVYIR